MPRLFSSLPALLLAASKLFNLVAKIGENLASKAPNQFMPAKQTKLTRGSYQRDRARNPNRNRSGDSVDEPRDSDQHPDHAKDWDNSHDRAHEHEKSPERSRPQNLASEKL